MRTIEVFASELLKMTVEDIRGDSAIFINIKDKEHQTEEHLAYLVELAQQREQESRFQPLKPEQSPRSSLCSSRSCTPEYDEEKESKRNAKREKEAYEALIADGCWPSHPYSRDFDVQNPGVHRDILWFWHADAGGFGFGQEFQHQLIEWKKFREFQDHMRQSYGSQNQFNKYEEMVQESLGNVKSKWDIRVHKDRHTQNRLEDWNEFRSFYYHKKLKPHRRRIAHAEKIFLDNWKQLEEIKPGLGGSAPSADDPPGENLMDAEKRRSYAEDRIRTAEQKLRHARSQCSEGQDVLIDKAQTQLELARRILSIQIRVCKARTDFGREQLDGKKWEVFVNWIDDQYAYIAAEDGYAATDSMHRPEHMSTNLRKRNQKPRLPLSPVRSAVSKRLPRKRADKSHQRIETPVVKEVLSNPKEPQRSQRRPHTIDRPARSTRHIQQCTLFDPVRPQKVHKPPKKKRASNRRHCINVGAEGKRHPTRHFGQPTDEVAITRYGRRVKRPERLGFILT